MLSLAGIADFGKEIGEMDKLLWLVLIFRLLRWAMPYLLGILGACLILGRIHPSALPRGFALPLFLTITCGLVYGLKSMSSNRREDRPRYPGRYSSRPRDRRWPDEHL